MIVEQVTRQRVVGKYLTFGTFATLGRRFFPSHARSHFVFVAKVHRGFGWFVCTVRRSGKDRKNAWFVKEKKKSHAQNCIVGTQLIGTCIHRQRFSHQNKLKLRNRIYKEAKKHIPVVGAVIRIIQHQFHLAGHAHNGSILHHRLEQNAVRMLWLEVQVIVNLDHVQSAPCKQKHCRDHTCDISE